MILGTFILLSISAAAFIWLALQSLWSDIRKHPLRHAGDDHTDTLGFSGKGFIQHGERR